MSDCYLGEIRLMAFNYAPQGWAKCDGTLLNIQQNQALFSLLANIYGGTYPQTFALPDLRGRCVTGRSNVTPLGTRYGEENHTLTPNETPAHTHNLMASTEAPDRKMPRDNLFATPPAINLYADPTPPLSAMQPGVVQPSGGGQSHLNIMPSIAVNYCIAVQGYYPPRD